MGEVELHLFEAGLVKELRSVFHVSGYIAADPDKLEPGNIPDLTRHEGKFADAMEFAEFYGVDDSGERIFARDKGWPLRFSVHRPGRGYADLSGSGHE